LDEEQIDRRAHWVQIAGAAIVAVTAWCVKLEMTTTQLKDDMINHIAARDVTISKLWDKLGEDHDKITKLEQWKNDQK
jgi:hypothetical protein